MSEQLNYIILIRCLLDPNPKTTNEEGVFSTSSKPTFSKTQSELYALQK